MLRTLTLVLALAAPAAIAAQERAATEGPRQPTVRVAARVVLLDRSEARRAGLEWVQVGGGRIRVVGSGRRGGVGAAGDVGGVPVSAFIALASERRLVRSDTRMQVTTLSGSGASIASGSLSIGAWGSTRTSGPELVVTPTVLEHGAVRLDVRVRLRDELTGVYGETADASPVDAATTVVVRPGEEATIGNVAVSEQRSDTGILRWESASRDRDVLVVLEATVVQ